MRVDDGRQSPVVAVAQGRGQVHATVAFLADALVNEHVGVDGHAEHQHQARHARQRERRMHCLHKANRQKEIGEKSGRRDQPGKAIVEDHERQDDRERQEDRERASADCILAERGAIVFSLTGNGLSVAGKAPERSKFTIRSTSVRSNRP